MKSLEERRKELAELPCCPKCHGPMKVASKDNKRRMRYLKCVNSQCGTPGKSPIKEQTTEQVGIVNLATGNVDSVVR